MDQRYTLDISIGTIFRIVLVIAFIALLLLLWKIVAGLFLAIIIAAALEPIIRFLGKWHIPRPVSVVGAYLFGLMVLGGVAYLIFPNLFFEFRDLSSTLPDRYAELIRSFNQQIGILALPEVNGEGLGNFFENLRDQMGLATSDFFSFAFSVFGGVISVVLMFVISFYLSLQENGIEKFLASIVPKDHREYTLDLWNRIQHKLSKWVQAQLILMLFVAFTLFPIFWALGIKYALTLALLAALFEVIPVIGPIIAGIILFFFILLQAPSLAVIAVIIYILLQQVQAHLVVPAVVSRALGINPVIIILLLIVGGTLAGFWGAILAIPLGAVVGELLKDLRVKR